MSKGVETSRNLLCEIGPLNGDREEKNTPFSGKTSTTPYDAVHLETDPFRRFFLTRVRSKGGWGYASPLDLRWGGWCVQSSPQVLVTKKKSLLEIETFGYLSVYSSRQACQSI